MHCHIRFIVESAVLFGYMNEVGKCVHQMCKEAAELSDQLWCLHGIAVFVENDLSSTLEYPLKFLKLRLFVSDLVGDYSIALYNAVSAMPTALEKLEIYFGSVSTNILVRQVAQEVVEYFLKKDGLDMQIYFSQASDAVFLSLVSSIRKKTEELRL